MELIVPLEEEAPLNVNSTLCVININMKKCSRCNILKSLSEFTNNKRMADGKSIHCNVCKKLFRKEYADRYPNEIKERKLKYIKNNKEKVSTYMKKYQESYKPIRNAREKERLLTEPEYLLRKRIRNNILRYVKRSGVKKTCASTKILGCSHLEFKTYFESKFTDGMTWEIFCNSDRIHIDHIIPVDAFDLTVEDELFKCFHFTNLQPLWKEDNLAKSNKLLHVK